MVQIESMSKNKHPSDSVMATAVPPPLLTPFLDSTEEQGPNSGVLVAVQIDGQGTLYLGGLLNVNNKCHPPVTVCWPQPHAGKPTAGASLAHRTIHALPSFIGRPGEKPGNRGNRGIGIGIRGIHVW